jgi:release factor glutamine methyltransferase
MGTVTWRSLQAEAVERLRSAGNPAAAAEVRWIMERASGEQGAAMLLTLDDPVTERAMGFFVDMLDRRAGGEPLQYVLGSWGFRTLDLYVDRRVLIPRPETEVVVAYAIDELDRLGGSIVVDLGTGSGAIALSIAVERPPVQVWATDASSDALEVAVANLAGIGRKATRVRVAEGSWFAALPDGLRGEVDVIVSNPPYVGASEPLPREVQDWEPARALVPGPSGLEAIEVIVAGAPAWLRRPGSLVVEIGETQGDAAVALAKDAGFADLEIRPDLVGVPRALVARV